MFQKICPQSFRYVTFGDEQTVHLTLSLKKGQLYGLQTAASPRRTNCKIQRNIKYEENNFGGGEFWMKI